MNLPKLNITVLCLTAITITEILTIGSSMFIILWMLYGFYKINESDNYQS